MVFNGTFWGQVFAVLAVIIIYFTVRFAKGKASNLPLVGFYSFLLNFIFPPGGWLYCLYWAKRKCV
ncbi:hypothetical protein GCM10009332_05870 [Shewanella gelidii]|uniref:Uncharacterized protein n=1 Tax=Shewanella gelidii TaxID=1642821 RepID=A0A917N6J7_9GAMM|nr:hypothetical protein GCM10009332_05870 [Shewanella gelidii]